EIYVDSLAKIGLIDREAVLWRVSQLELERERLFVYGYFRARKEEILFIDRFAADESVFFLPCHENSIFEVNRTWAHTLNELGWTIDAANDLTTNDISPGTEMASRFINVGLDKDSLQERGNDGTAIAYPSIEAEVRGTIARAKHLVIEGVRPEKIAIVCRTVQPYASLIASVSREYGLPVEMKHMIPVGQTPVGEFVKLLLGSVGPEAESEGEETVDRPFEFETTARMLLHPLGPGITGDKWPDARRSHPGSLDDWQKLGTDLAILQVPERQSYKEWAAWLVSVFGSFRVREKAGSNAAELTALNRLIDAINEQTPRQVGRALSFEGFAAEIFDILSMVTTPFGTASGGVVLHQPNTVIGGKFDHIFVLGMAEGMLPAKVTENPIIDFHERKRLSGFGIEFEDAAEVPRWEALSFYFVLLAGAKSLSFSYPRYVDGDPRLPNSYFEKLGLSPEEAAEEFVSSREELRRVFLAGAESPVTDEVLERAKFQFAVERRRESSEPFDDFDGVVGKALDPSRRTWSVSQLTKIGQCPFKWFSEKVLGLGPPEEADLELPPATKGTLYHKTLEIAVQNAIAADDLRAAVLANLDAAFAEAEASDGLLVASVANWELQRSEHLELLRKVVRSSSFIAEGARVLAVEQEFNTVWMDLPIRGRIDRIDDGP
ncbi:MAG TPA: PD-(D/E)XK nuclease family protein, partial [Pyrinomonadaceae bacterium]|nr:PD-(D/E)XK nuclease family protein [Pyrinomonadaceae bacterium]